MTDEIKAPLALNMNPDDPAMAGIYEALDKLAEERGCAIAAVVWKPGQKMAIVGSAMKENGGIPGHLFERDPVEFFHTTAHILSMAGRLHAEEKAAGGKDAH